MSFARAFLLGRLVLMFDAGVDISINFDFNFKQRGKTLLPTVLPFR